MNYDKTLHIVYSLPQTKLEKLFFMFLRSRLGGRNLESIKWPFPIKAPLSITYNIAQTFCANMAIKLYDLRERVKIVPEKGDVLLGHPHMDPQSVLWDALDNPDFSAKYIISPYNHNSSQVLWFREAVNKCDRYFAICGQYWFDTFSKSPFHDMAEKIIHVNMSINSVDYPVVKKKFNPPGKRRFFYIGRYGHFGDEKGIGLLEQLAAKIPGFQGGYICEGGEIRGWDQISQPTRLTPEFMETLAGSYDFFINMSRADAQATTVLEAMSWGFPVACTQETGYSDETLFYLDIDSLEVNAAVIEHMQNLPDEELHRISKINRSLVETKYNWHHFGDVLKKHIIL
jgi:glycosyltransferase involved in cell wall biosynthesis